MQKKYASEISSHKLRREIIATQLCNAMINRGGATYLERIQSQSGASTTDIAKAYVLVREAFGFRAFNARIDALDTKIAGRVQLDLYYLLRRILIGQTNWALRNVTFKKSIAEAIKPIADGIAAMKPNVVKLLPAYMKAAKDARYQDYLDNGVPKDIAADFALLPALDLVPNIIIISQKAKQSLEASAEAYFALDDMFKVNHLDALAAQVATNDHYDSLALWRGRQQLAKAHRAITHDVLTKHKTQAPVTAWHEAHKEAIEAAKEALDEITSGGTMSVAKTSVAANVLSDLTKGA